MEIPACAMDPLQVSPPGDIIGGEVGAAVSRCYNKWGCPEKPTITAATLRYLTFESESIVISLRSPISQHRLRPAVPPTTGPYCQDFFEVDIVAATQSGWTPHLLIEQGRKEIRILTYTMRETDGSGAGQGDFILRGLQMKGIPHLVDGECLLDSHSG